jgi:hypothetical protein
VFRNRSEQKAGSWSPTWRGAAHARPEEQEKRQIGGDRVPFAMMVPPFIVSGVYPAHIKAAEMFHENSLIL